MNQPAFLQKLLASLLAASLLLTPGAATAAEASWDVSRSKTATNLDEQYVSRVTLSLPSAEEALVSDVVFVLDESSCSDPVKAEVSRMLDSLYAQARDTGATIQVGAVQFRGEVTSLPLTPLTEATREQVAAFMSARPETGGSNMSAGLLAGEAMLDADAGVDANRKYLILVSDGITYIWDDETTPTQENYGVNFANADAPNTPMLASPDGWDVRHGNGYIPADWDAALAETGALLNRTVAEKASLYVRGADLSGLPFVAYGQKEQFASTVDIALYQAQRIYQRIADKYPHTYAVLSGVESEMAVYPFGPSFMRYLADGAEVSFAGILREIVYLVDAGSRVEDRIGYVAGEYNFDFIDDPAALSLRVGANRYDAARLPDGSYGFKPLPDGEYAYTVVYEPGNLADTERFVWHIHEPISNFAPVQLTYMVRLTNPCTAPGTYGQYDADGSQGYAGLHTNVSAVLTPVDSNGETGAAVAFARPTVSYTVQAMPPASSEPDAPSQPDAPPTGQGGAAVWALVSLSAGGLGAVTACAARSRRRR